MDGSLRDPSTPPVVTPSTQHTPRNSQSISSSFLVRTHSVHEAFEAGVAYAHLTAVCQEEAERVARWGERPPALDDLAGGGTLREGTLVLLLLLVLVLLGGTVAHSFVAN